MTEKGMPRRQYTAEFVAEAMRLSQSVGSHEAARRLGIPIGSLKNWLKRSRKADGEASATDARQAVPAVVRRPVSEVEAENSRLRKELASARLDIEILRKATAYFAKGSR
jgi:transposase